MDHVLNGGMAYRGPSEMTNLVTLCRRHHRIKTEAARVSRRLLVAYLAMRAAVDNLGGQTVDKSPARPRR
jgi:hypothetical protein